MKNTKSKTNPQPQSSSFQVPTTDNVNISALTPQKVFLDNKLPVFILNNSDQPIIRIDFIFNAGTYYQDVPFQAASACSMLSESTQKHTAKYIAEKLDFFGAHLEKEIGRDFVTISLYCINKQLANILPIVEQILKQPKYEEKEFRKYIVNEKQKHINSMQKVQNIARMRFQELVYGTQHPYGRILKAEEFDILQNTDLEKFHKNYYTSNNCKIILAGCIHEKEYQLVNSYFGGDDWDTKIKTTHKKYQTAVTKPTVEIIRKEGAVQSAVCIGKALINSEHEDFSKLSIINTILGGYFGSRLMKNIREEKGYTYGIGSGVVSYKNQGLFCISTQTAAETTHLCIEEIYKELKFLRTNPVSKEELALVKNYLIGEFMREVDGPLDMAERLKLLVQMDYSVNYYQNYLDAINLISQDDVLRLSEKYLHEDSMVQVVAGEILQ